MNKLLISLFIVIFCSGCMNEIIAKKYKLDEPIFQTQVQLNPPIYEPYKAYYIGSDLELKMNTKDYIIVKIDDSTYRFVSKSEVEERLRQQMTYPTLAK